MIPRRHDGIESSTDRESTDRERLTTLMNRMDAESKKELKRIERALAQYHPTRPFAYAMKLTVDKRDGAYVVTCRDLPEVLTQGYMVEEEETLSALAHHVKGDLIPRSEGQ